MYSLENSPNSHYTEVIQWINKHRKLVSGGFDVCLHEELQAVVNMLGKALFKSINRPRIDLALIDCRRLRTAALILENKSQKNKLALYERCLRNNTPLNYTIAKHCSLEGTTLIIEKLDAKLMEALKKAKDDLPATKIRVGDSKEEFTCALFFECIFQGSDNFEVKQQNFLDRTVNASDAFLSMIKKRPKNFTDCTSACPLLQIWLDNTRAAKPMTTKPELFEKDVLVLPKELFPLNEDKKREIIKTKSAIRVAESQRVFTHEEITSVFNAFKGSDITLDLFIVTGQKLYDIPFAASAAFMIAHPPLIQEGLYQVHTSSFPLDEKTVRGLQSLSSPFILLDGKQVYRKVFLSAYASSWKDFSNNYETLCTKVGEEQMFANKSLQNSYLLALKWDLVTREALANKLVAVFLKDSPSLWPLILKLPEACGSDPFLDIAPKGVALKQDNFPLTEEIVEKIRKSSWNFIAVNDTCYGKASFLAAYTYACKYKLDKGWYDFSSIFEAMGRMGSFLFKKFLMTDDDGALVDFLSAARKFPKNNEALQLLLDCDEENVQLFIERRLHQWLKSSHPSYPIVERLNRLKYEHRLNYINLKDLCFDYLGYQDGGNRISVYSKTTQEGLKRLEGGNFHSLDLFSYEDCVPKTLFSSCQITHLSIDNRRIYRGLIPPHITSLTVIDCSLDRLDDLSHLPLKAFSLSNYSYIDDGNALKHLKAFPLKKLELNLSSRFKGRDLYHLKDNLGLEEVRLDATWFDNNDIAELNKTLPFSVKSLALDLSGNKIVTDGVTTLLHKSIKKLNIQNTKLTSWTVNELAKKFDLNEIKLDEHQLTEKTSELFKNKNVTVHKKKNLEYENNFLWNVIWGVGLVAGAALFGIAVMKK